MVETRRDERQIAQAWQATSRGIVKGTKIRIGMAGAILAASATVALPLTCAVLFAVIFVTQIVVRQFHQKMAQTGGTQKQRWVALGLTFGASSIWNLIPAIIWYVDVPLSRIFAILILFGTLIHMSAHEHRTASEAKISALFIVTVLPQVLTLLHLPIALILTDDSVPLYNAALLYFGLFLLVGYFWYEARSIQRMYQREEDARAAAEVGRREAEAASRAKSEFLALISHELRTPLSGVIGMADSFGPEDIRPGATDRLNIIRASGHTVLQLINDLLDFSKLDAGETTLESEPFTIEDIFRRLESLNGATARAKGLTLRLASDPSVADRRVGDASRLVQALTNLIGNAIKFTDEGEISLDVKPGDGADELIFEVSDTGIGMTPEQTSELFGAFRQAERFEVRTRAGTGLGLAIVRAVVDKMGGEIVVTSVPDAGTTVRLILDLPVLAEASRPEEPVSIGHAPGVRALVVDDNAVNLAVIKALGNALGMEVVTAGSGEEAIGLARDGRFDIVLMDISMPDMDGIAARRHIEDVLGDATPPIIAVTAHVLPDEVRTYAKEGFEGYIAKPVTKSALCAQIARVKPARSARKAVA